MSIYNDDGVYDENGREISPYDDDYEYYKREQERRSDPLDDDYNKYENE